MDSEEWIMADMRGSREYLQRAETVGRVSKETRRRFGLADEVRDY